MLGVFCWSVAVHQTTTDLLGLSCSGDLAADSSGAVSSLSSSLLSSSQMVHLTWRRVPGVKLSSAGMSCGSADLRFLEGELACGGFDDMA